MFRDLPLQKGVGGKVVILGSPIGTHPSNADAAQDGLSMGLVFVQNPIRTSPESTDKAVLLPPQHRDRQVYVWRQRPGAKQYGPGMGRSTGAEFLVDR